MVIGASRPDQVQVPTADPGAGYRAYRAEIDNAIHRVLDSGWYILGQEVNAFEAEFAPYVGVKHAVGTASGTDALLLALRACGVGRGDIVVTVSHTAVATVAAIELSGATPVLVDIDPTTFTMDPSSLEAALQRTPGRIRAIVPVHLYGHPADMPVIMDLARRFDVTVIEDCCQSHGASLFGRPTGSWGQVAAFSFYPTKNLGALGDGGAVVTSDPALAEQCRLLRQYGWRERNVSDAPGMNTRLDEIQAAILRVKLRYLADNNVRRREIARSYGEHLAGTATLPPRSSPGVEHVYHQYVVRTARRDALRAFLRSRGVETAVLYPKPVHSQPAYHGRVDIAPWGLPNTDRVCLEILSLPMYPELTAAQVEYVGQLLGDWASGAETEGEG